jgi:uncharacterized protein (TIGR03083 family)
MERDYTIGIVQREAERVLRLADGPSADLAAPVASCPEWDFAALLNHLGNVYNWAGTIVERRLLAPPGREIPPRPDGVSPQAWLADRLDRILAAFREVPDDAEMWNFTATSPGPPSFWWRRQLHETAIHRVDAELACAVAVDALEPELAADNVSELFDLFGFTTPAETPAEAPPGTGASEPAPSRDGQPFTVHLHATDVEGAEWTLDTVARTVTAAHAKADVALRGTAWSLARWTWGRPVGGEIEVFGDIEAAENWRRTISP